VEQIIENGVFID
jgi:hypothetical protein